MSGRRAGCPGLREVPDVRASGPDVRAGVASLGALWIGGVRMSGGSGRAGYPGLWPDVRADGVRLRVRSVMGAGFPGVGPDVRAGARCPGPVVAGSSSFSFLCFRACLALVLGFSMVSSGVPEYAQGPHLK